MPDKWDSADGQTHDESELIATDELIAAIRYRATEDSEMHMSMACSEMRRILARLDAAERERDALKAAMPKPTASDWECAVDICKGHTAAYPDRQLEWMQETRNIIAAHVQARVAEAVRPLRECVGELLVLVGDSSGVYAHRKDGTEVKWGWGEIDAIAHARRLMEEADRD